MFLPNKILVFKQCLLCDTLFLYINENLHIKPIFLLTRNLEVYVMVALCAMSHTGHWSHGARDPLMSSVSMAYTLFAPWPAVPGH